VLRPTTAEHTGINPNFTNRRETRTSYTEPVFLTLNTVVSLRGGRRWPRRPLLLPSGWICWVLFSGMMAALSRAQTGPSRVARFCRHAAL
jgi:hypothetical protein